MAQSKIKTLRNLSVEQVHSIEFISDDDGIQRDVGNFPAVFDWIIEDNFITLKITWDVGMFGGVGKEYTIEIVELAADYQIFKTAFGMQTFYRKKYQ